MNRKLIFGLVFFINMPLQRVLAFNNELSRHLVYAVQNNEKKFLDEILAEVLRGKKAVDVTDTLNVIAHNWKKDCSLKKSLLRALPLSFCFFSGYLLWPIGNSKIRGFFHKKGCARTFVGDSAALEEYLKSGSAAAAISKGNATITERQYDAFCDELYVYHKDGTEKKVSRSVATSSTKHSLIKNASVAGVIWASLGLYRYVTKKRYYKHIIKKIIQNPYVVFDESRLKKSFQCLINQVRN